MLDQPWGEKLAFDAPHSGHIQESGTVSNGVPGATPLSGSPFAGSYTYPQTSQTYFFICYSCGEKLVFGTPQSGQFHVSGSFSNGVSGSKPLAGSPIPGLYT